MRGNHGSAADQEAGQSCCHVPLWDAAALCCHEEGSASRGTEGQCRSPSTWRIELGALAPVAAEAEGAEASHAASA